MDLEISNLLINSLFTSLLQKKSRTNRPVAHSTISRTIGNLGDEMRNQSKHGKPRDGHGFVDTMQDEDGRFVLYCINENKPIISI